MTLAERIALGAISIMIVTLPFAHSVAVRNVALGIALVATAFAWRALRVPRPPLLWYFGALALLGGLSLIWSIDPAYSRGELKPELLYPFVVFVLLFAVCRDRAALAWLGVATAFAIALSAGGPFTAWFDWHAGRPGRGVLYNGAGFYSTWVVIAYPFALAAALSPALDRRRRQLAAVLAIVALGAGYVTFNRTFPYVAAFETICILGWDLLYGRGSNRLARTVMAVAAAGVLAGGLFLVQQERHAALPKADQEVATMQRDVRWTVWSEAVGRIAAEPLRGAGFGRGILRQDLQKRYPDTFLWHAHSMPVNWGLQMGVPGVALLLALFGAAVWHLARAYRIVDADLRPYVVAAIVMVIGVFLKNQTDDFFVRQTALAFWAALAAVLGVVARVSRERAPAQ